MFKVTFNGDTKQIVVNSDVSSVDVKADLYSAWKAWTTFDTNAQYLPAFRTFGGDPTSSGQVAPQYFFLTNGWRVTVDGHYVTFETNLYTDEGDSPFILQNGGEVLNKISDSPTVTVDGGALNTDEHDALLGIKQVVLDARDTVLSGISDSQIDLLAEMVNSKVAVLDELVSNKNEILTLVTSEKDELSTQLDNTSNELSQKMDIISQLINGNKYKAFV